MPTQKYLCMYRGVPSQNKPSPAQMQEMFVAVSRVLAFRHWASDVTASAAIGIIVAATLVSPPSGT